MSNSETDVQEMRKEARSAPRLASRLFEQVADALRIEISSGAISSGTILRELGVAERFNVSRAPARMALEALEKEGILALEQGGRRVTARPAGSAVPILSQPAIIAPELAWERIYGDVETAIVARMSFGSWRLIESDLARHYDVSRTVAREVLGRLQQRGLVKKDQRAHWFVPGLGPDYVSDLYEMRWTLEPAALLNAAPNIPPDMARAYLGNVERSIIEADALASSVLDELENELHCNLLAFCNNQTMLDSIKVYQSLLVAHRYLYRAQPRVFPTEPFLPEHRGILDAIVAGHPADAARLLEHHLRVSRERAIYRIGVVRKVLVPDPLSYLKPLGGEEATAAIKA